MLLVRESKDVEGGASIEIRWDLLPSFISVQGDLHVLLAQAMNEEFAGKLTTSGDGMHKAHCFICEWLQERLPMYEGLGMWLGDLQDVKERIDAPDRSATGRV